MLVYINGPQWFVLSFGLFLASCLVVAVSILYVIRKKKAMRNISEVDTKLLPTPPAKRWQRTAAQIGESSDMSLTSLNKVQRRDGPRPARLVRLPETPIPPIQQDDRHLAKVKVFGVWVSSYDQYGDLIFSLTGLKSEVEKKIQAADPMANVAWEEMNSVDAVVDRALLRRAINIREISPIK